MTTNRKIVLKIVIINTSVLFSLLLCEGVLRYIPSINNSRIAAKQYKSQIIWLDEETRSFRKNIHQEFEEAYRPEGETYFSRTQPRLFRTDDKGYILGSPTEQNNFATFKVLFSGGSVVECQEVDEPFRFAFAVQSLLNERGLPEIETLNLGVRGHTTFETLKLMTGTNLFEGFQAILFMHNINDWTVLVNCNSYFSSSSDKTYSRHGTLKRQINEFIDTTREVFIDQSSLAYLLDNLRQKYFSSDILPQAEEQVVIDDEKVNQILDIYRRNIMNLAGLAYTKGARPVFLTEPSPVKGGLQEELNSELRNICQTQGYSLIDVAQSLPENSEYLFFPDRVHLNNNGSLFVAQIIADKLPFVLESQLSELPIHKQWLDKLDKMLKEANICDIDIPYNARYPVLTKDLNKLYFQSVFNGNNQICCIDIQKGTLNRISPFSHNFWHPCPSGNDTVYAVSDCLGGEKIFEFTKQKMTLLSAFDVEDFNGAIPAVSSENQICFPGYPPKDTPDLFIFSPSDGQIHQITKTDYEEWRPVFHPNGREIYYISNKNGNFDIFCHNIQKNSDEYVIGTDGDDWDVDISPCGNLLVFAARQKGNFNLMLYNINTKMLVQLTNGAGNEWDPRFMANGGIIIYAEELNNKSSIKFIRVPSI
jgi:hypothetical protein